jgi:hypothetical protein
MSSDKFFPDIALIVSWVNVMPQKNSNQVL